MRGVMKAVALYDSGGLWGPHVAPERYGGHSCRALVGALAPCGVAGLVGRVAILAVFCVFDYKMFKWNFLKKKVN